MQQQASTGTIPETLKTRLREQINSDRIVVYIKGTKDFPMCGFSATVVGIFKQLGVPFSTINVLADNDIREGVKAFSEWPTIPQAYLNGEFIGGCDVVRAMHENGELKPAVDKALSDPQRVI